MRTDDIEPFRAEFERCCDLADVPTVYRIASSFAEHAEQDGWATKPNRAKIMPSLYDKAKHIYDAYRAAKALQIAETQGPDAAILWKLSN